MKRREFIAGISAAAWPLAARAQQRMPTVGLLSGVSIERANSYAPVVDEIRQGLKDVGFVEGQNMLIEYRSADGHPERVKDLADDLVRRQVAVIVAIGGSNTALAAKAATPTIPIVFAAGGDALENGLVKNFNKPEANVTGMSFNTRQMAPKRLDFLRTLLPQATLFGYLDNVATASEIARQQFVASARSAGAEIVVFYAGTAVEIDSAFETMVQQRVQGVVVSTDAYLATRYDQIISLAKLHALPVIYSGLMSVSGGSPIRSGGLMVYVLADQLYRRAGEYAGRLLKGANVADLPVEMPIRFNLGINLKTAKALGLTIPPNLLAIADEVIE
jgi:putative tryptophan/tyrosine transport system substrate-binding protein